MGTTVVKRNASNSDLQRAIEAAIPTAVAQMKQRSNEFKGRTEAETCKKIFDYLLILAIVRLPISTLLLTKVVLSMQFTESLMLRKKQAIKNIKT